ncbi:MAG: hypothetical protein JNK58_02415 [Phycisphaerae bacterium]|nr:hypothetical protein [Phycisphaerae bacterium]
MKFVAAAAAASVIALSANARASVEISDNTFNMSDWSHSAHQFGPFGGSGSIGQTPLGRTGSGLEINNSCGPSFSGVWNAGLYLPFSYNPSAAGVPLTDLTLSIDSRHTGGLQAVSFVVEQGGEMWRVGYFINTPSWATYSIMDPMAADIVPLTAGAMGLPDFSVSGGAIRFGIAAGNSSAGGSGYSTTGYYDNFQVLFVPSPATLPFGMVAVGLLRRRLR